MKKSLIQNKIKKSNKNNFVERNIMLLFAIKKIKFLYYYKQNQKKGMYKNFEKKLQKKLKYYLKNWFLIFIEKWFLIVSQICVYFRIKTETI